MTDAYGDFTVVIDAGNEEDSIDILRHYAVRISII